MSQLESSEPQSPVFQHKLGDKVLARWSDGKDYPGIVQSYFPDGAYNVIFYDGYRKKVKAKYIASLPEDYNETLVPPSSVPSVPVTETTAPLQVEGDKAPKMEVSIVPAVMTHPSKEFFIEEDHNHFKCPAENCTKAFRKEKALSGHLKHYHPELNSQSKRRSKPPVSKHNDLSNLLKETSTKIQEVIPPPIEDKPAKKTNLMPSKDSQKSPSKSKKDKNDSHNTPVTDKESNTCHKASTKSSNIKGNDKTKNSLIKQQDAPLKNDETPIPIKTNHEPLNNNLNVYKPLELQMSSEVTASNPPMTLFTPSPIKKEQNNQQSKKETQPKPSNNQQPQQLNQPPPTGKKRGRKRKSEIEANELARLKEESKTNKVRVVEKVSSVSPSMYLDESNPIPNPVLPFSDPRTIREIHESDDVDELVNCICDLRKESGLMVQCECCLTWQHGSCLGIKADKDLPDVYVCFICKNPRGSREKCRYKYDWNWLRNGTLPLFPGFDSSSSKLNSTFLCKKNIVTTNQLLNDALEILNIIHDLKHKIQLLDLNNGDLSLWNTSWVASKEAKIIPTREQEIVHNDFVGLKANENDMINDILDFSKNILETVTSDDKNDVPDDLENEIAEGTDLIDFIASSYSEMNGTKEEEDTIAETPIPENQPPESEMMETATLATTNLEETLPETTLVTTLEASTLETQNQETSTSKTPILATSTSESSTLETPILEMQTQEAPILATSALETSTLASSSTFTLTPTIATSTSETEMLEAPSLDTQTLEKPNLEKPNLETPNLETPNLETPNLETPNLETPNLETSNLETSNLETPNLETATLAPATLGLPALELPSLEVPNIGISTLELSNLKTSTFERLISGSEVVEADQTTIRRQNLIKHILDVRERLEKKLDLIKVKVCELEKEYGLDPDPDAVEQDACAFRNAIKNLYADLEIVHQMSLCTTLN